MQTNLHAKRRRSARAITSLCAGVTIVSGCYASHTLPLEGERYACQCQWTQLIPHVDWDCDEDGCRPEPCGGTDCFDELVTMGGIRPCTTFEGDPTAVCEAACADPRFAPDVTTETEVLSASYASVGWCSTLDDPPREFFFPEVPADAVRHGHVVAELSTLQLTIDGIGTTAEIHPVDGTPVTIQGGNCDAPPGCELSINDIRVEIAGPVDIAGHTLDGLVLTNVESMVTSARVLPNPAAPDAWDLLADTPEHSELPLQFLAGLDGAENSGPLAWRRPLAAPDDGPGGAFDLRRGSLDPHMTFTGVLRDSVALDDGSTLEVTLDADIYVRFFSGAPVPRMAVVDTGVAMGPLVLDGSGTYDDLGAPASDFRWYLLDGEGNREIIAHGIRAVLPRAVMAELDPDKTRLCLRAADDDGLYDEVCSELAPISDPSVPPPDCRESGTTLTGAWRFGELVEFAGLGGWLASKQGITVLVPSDEAIAAHFGKDGPKDAEAAGEFVLTHVLEGRHSAKDLRQGAVDLSKNLAGLNVTTKPSDVADATELPDVDCWDGGGVTHRVAITLTTP
ncbi:MAG: fasciclin domain-containing protein [Deltaproteobacteria bacterium]|nr:fasciclin domain-containing protein [Deltaproteobacteria bacterium]MBK8716059.1 fasciclin domain-containing protein [Deltaproteobacteria bacterium]MBP7286868.1 fasciclin domain-containing protein [Nannocystaceae bacterium]